MNPNLNNEKLSSELDVTTGVEMSNIVVAVRKCVFCGQLFPAVDTANICKDEECQDKLDSYYINMLTASQEWDHHNDTVEYGEAY